MDTEIAVKDDVEEYREMDRIGAECLTLPSVEAPLIHTWTKGLYIREIHLKAGTLAVTKIHNTQHPYVILKGKVSVTTDGENWTYIEAPFNGITEPGTQRFIVVYEDTIWITYHPNPDDEKDLIKIEEKIIRKHEIPPELLAPKDTLNLEQNEESLK